jgi:hypothetical protein
MNWLPVRTRTVFNADQVIETVLKEVVIEQ